MPEHVGTDHCPLFARPSSDQILRVPPDEFVDAKPCERMCRFESNSALFDSPA